jgi:predicted transcriptional regulator
MVEPADAGGAALRRIVDKIFQGSAEMAVARLVSQHRLRPEEVARMKSLLDDAARRDEEDGGPADDEGGEEEE